MAYKEQCKICGKFKKASTKIAFDKGLFICGCNSVDYNKALRFRRHNKLEEANCAALTEEINIVVYGPPAIKKNGQQIVKMGNVPMIQPSKKYVYWASNALKQIEDYIQTRNPRVPINDWVEIEAHYYRDTRVRCDLSNLHEGIQDCLTVAGIWIDDSIVLSHDGSRKHYDPSNPRIEVTIRKYKGEVENEEEIYKEYKKSLKNVQK